MIYVGIDDTDMPDTPGTNQLAKVLVALVADRYRCRTVLRHQLFFDPRVPYTSKNGSASILLEPVGAVIDGIGHVADLIAAFRPRMLEWYVPGSDPALCVTTTVPDAVIAWGQRCQRDLVTREEAEDLARRSGIYLEGLGGTRGGMIGALAAVGLAATQNDGRVVVHGQWPDDLDGLQPVSALVDRGIVIRCIESGEQIHEGHVDVGKHLRPNLRDGHVVVFVQPVAAPEGKRWQAVRLT